MVLVGAGVGMRAEARLSVSAPWGIRRDCRSSMWWDGASAAPAEGKSTMEFVAPAFAAATLASPSELV